MAKAKHAMASPAPLTAHKTRQRCRRSPAAAAPIHTHATDGAIQANVVQVLLRCLHLTLVFLAEVAAGEQIRLTERGVVVEVKLSVADENWRKNDRQECMLSGKRVQHQPPTASSRRTVAVRRLGERVDLDQGGIGVDEQLVQVAEHVLCLNMTIEVKRGE